MEQSKAYKEGYEKGTWIDMYDKIHVPYEKGSQESKDYLRGLDHAIEDRLS